MIGAAAALILIAGPLLLGGAGFIFASRLPADAPSGSAPWDWRLSACSSLLYTLAFNLTFFIQEFWLVLPKAFTPGLRPTLFHNNHTWTGNNPLQGLLQGSGALAILLTGGICALLLRRPGRSPTLRLFLIWMAYNGFFQSLPQLVVGALIPANDVGMAMDYLQLSGAAKTAAALAALAAMPLIALRLTGPLLGLAAHPLATSSPAARTQFVFRTATLPALGALPLIVLFRVPRDWIEVVLVPVVATVIGIAWMQAAAWRTAVSATVARRAVSIAYPLAAAVLLLLVFQLLLRPGIHFYRQACDSCFFDRQHQHEAAVLVRKVAPLRDRLRRA